MILDYFTYCEGKLPTHYLLGEFWVSMKLNTMYQNLIETRADRDHITPSYLGRDVSLYLHSFQFDFDTFVFNFILTLIHLLNSELIVIVMGCNLFQHHI